MDEKYVEAYYRLQALVDFISLSGKYVTKNEILAILGMVDTIDREAFDD